MSAKTRIWMDAHCHLSDDTFAESREDIYAELLEHDVRGLVLAGTEPPDWAKQSELRPPEGLRIARVYGMHPWWVDSYSDADLEAAITTLERTLPDCEGIGELGLDYHRAKSPTERSRQRLWFEAQLSLARSAPDHPLVLHVVRAHHEALPILRKQRRKFRGLVHAFWANRETAEAYIALGFLLSIPPRIMKEDPHGLLRDLDPEALVFETDTPFFDAEARCVRPVFIQEMLEFVAQKRQESLDTTLDRQTRLLCELFPVLKA